MLTLRFTVGEREFARAWLFEYFRRPGWRVVRVALGPAVIALGVSMLRAGTSSWLGGAIVVFGLYYALKPLLGVWQAVRQRRALGIAEMEIELVIGRKGVRIDDGKARTQFSWEDIRGAGRGRGYFWYALNGGARATIPDRAVEAPAELEAIFREHTRWQ